MIVNGTPAARPTAAPPSTAGAVAPPPPPAPAALSSTPAADQLTTKPAPKPFEFGVSPENPKGFHSLFPDYQLSQVTVGKDGVVFGLNEGGATCNLRLSKSGKTLEFNYSTLDTRWFPVRQSEDFTILKRILSNAGGVDAFKKSSAFTALNPAQKRAADEALEQMWNVLPPESLTTPGPRGLRVKEHYVTSPDGVSIFVREVGGGDPDAKTIYMCHGFGADHQYMKVLEPMLASDDLRLVFYDQRAAGLSTRPAQDAYHMINGQAGYDPNSPEPAAGFTVDKHLADLNAVRQRTRNPEVANPYKELLFGHSWGGRIVQEALIQESGAPGRPHLIGAFLPDCTPPTSDSYNAGQNLANQRWADLQTQGLIPQDADFPPVTPWNDGTAQAMAGDPFYWANPKDPRMKKDKFIYRAEDNYTMNAMNNYDLTAALAKVTIPMGVFVGQFDGFGEGWGQDNANAFGVPLHVFQNCGHVSFSDNSELFSKIFKETFEDMMSGDPSRWEAKPATTPPATTTPAAANPPAPAQ